MQFCFPFAAALACVVFLSACAEPAEPPQAPNAAQDAAP